MNDTELNLEEVSKQIDFHLSKIQPKALPPHFDLDDLRQEIFVGLIKRRALYKPGKSGRKTYFDRLIDYRIKHSLCILHRKKNRTEQSISGEAFDNIPLLNDVRQGELKSAESNVFSQEVWSVVEQMPDEEREYCELLMHYRPDKVALMMGVSKHTVFRKMKLIKPYFLKAGLKPGNFNEN